jgi:hypothetical protein
MSQITLAIRRAPKSERLFRWQAAVVAAFAGGSLTARMFNIGALMALLIARFTLLQIANARRGGEYHA